MVDIQDFTKAGEFLRAENVKDGAAATIIGVAEVVHNDMYDKDRLHIPVEITSKKYTFDCSKTNARTITETLGAETEKWVGKQLQLETYKTKTSDGKMTNATNVKNIIL